LSKAKLGRARISRACQKLDAETDPENPNQKSRGVWRAGFLPLGGRHPRRANEGTELNQEKEMTGVNRPNQERHIAGGILFAGKGGLHDNLPTDSDGLASAGGWPWVSPGGF